MATHWDKYIIKRYEFKRLLRVEELTDEIICIWYKKEYIIYNILYVFGKKKSDIYDPLNKDEQKKEYLMMILDVFGFKSMVDFESKIELTPEVRERIKNLSIVQYYNEYKKMMGIFKKQIRKSENNDIFDLNKVMKTFNCILGDYGIIIASKQKRIRQKQNRFYKITFFYKNKY